MSCSMRALRVLVMPALMSVALVACPSKQTPSPVSWAPTPGAVLILGWDGESLNTQVFELDLKRRALSQVDVGMRPTALASGSRMLILSGPTPASIRDTVVRFEGGQPKEIPGLGIVEGFDPALSPDEKQLAYIVPTSTGGRRTIDVRVWNFASQQLKTIMVVDNPRGHATLPVSAPAFGPDSQLAVLLPQATPPKVRIVDASGRTTAEYALSLATPYRLMWSRSGLLAIVDRRLGETLLMNSAGKIARRVKGHALCFLEGGRSNTLLLQDEAGLVLDANGSRTALLDAPSKVVADAACF